MRRRHRAHHETRSDRLPRRVRKAARRRRSRGRRSAAVPKAQAKQRSPQPSTEERKTVQPSGEPAQIRGDDRRPEKGVDATKGADNPMRWLPRRRPLRPEQSWRSQVRSPPCPCSAQRPYKLWSLHRAYAADAAPRRSVDAVLSDTTGHRHGNRRQTLSTARTRTAAVCNPEWLVCSAHRSSPKSERCRPFK